MGRILVLDDDPAMLELISRIIAPEAHTVSLASSASEAIDMARSAEQPYHVLITDIVLGARDRGYEVAWQLTADDPHLRVLLVSGYAKARDDLPKMIWASRAALLEKPFSPDSLRQAVRFLLS